jgi:hypothetical protein
LYKINAARDDCRTNLPSGCGASRTSPAEIGGSVFMSSTRTKAFSRRLGRIDIQDFQSERCLIHAAPC